MRIAGTIAAMLAGTVAAVLLGELALRTIIPGYSPITLDLYYRDADGQLRMKPNARRQHTTREWSVTVETNAAGFRETDEPPPADRPLVLTVGDSMAFGWGVERTETFCAGLERALGAARPARVFNASVPSTGTTDQLPLLERLLGEFEPAVVLVAFYVGNDFTDVAAGGAAQFDVVDGLLRLRGRASGGWLTHLKSWVLRKSYFAQLAARELWVFQQRGANRPIERRAHDALDDRDRWLRSFVQVHLQPWTPELRQAIDLTLDTLERMRRLSESRGARFVLLTIPRNIQVFEADRRPYAHIGVDEWDLDQPQRALNLWATARKVEHIDLLPAFRKAAAERPVRLYFSPDSHLSAEGHAVAARELARHFEAHPITGPGT